MFTNPERDTCPKWPEEYEDKKIENLIAYIAEKKSFLDIVWLGKCGKEEAKTEDERRGIKTKGKEKVADDTSISSEMNFELKRREVASKTSPNPKKAKTVELFKQFVDDRINKLSAQMEEAMAKTVARVSKLEQVVKKMREPNKVRFKGKSPTKQKEDASTSVSKGKGKEKVKDSPRKNKKSCPSNRPQTRSQEVDDRTISSHDNESRIEGKVLIEEIVVPVVADNINEAKPEMVDSSVKELDTNSVKELDTNSQLREKATEKKAERVCQRMRSTREKVLAAAKKSPYVDISKKRKIIIKQDFKSYLDVDPLSVKALDDWLNRGALRFKNNPESFRSRRIAFLDAVFSMIWSDKYKYFLTKKDYFPGGALDYLHGQCPAYAKSEKQWGIDIDDLYGIVHVGGNHWVAYVISILNRTITVMDSSIECNTDAVIESAMQPFAHMVPHLLRHQARKEDQFAMSIEPYTTLPRDRSLPSNKIPYGDCGVYALKFIECHALGLKPPKYLLCDKNIGKIREKMAAEMFVETFKYGESMSTLEYMSNIMEYDSVEIISKCEDIKK